jgi:putative transposase
MGFPSVNVIVKFLESSREHDSLEVKTMLVSYKHCVVNSNWHLQFTPKYRRNVFGDEVLKAACRVAFRGVAERLGVDLRVVSFGPDHVHLFVCGCKNYAVPYLAQRFKGYSSWFLRKFHWNRFRSQLWGDSFWSDGYFGENVGRVTEGTAHHYIACQQRKHWVKPKEPAETIQRRLADYS